MNSLARFAGAKLQHLRTMTLRQACCMTAQRGAHEATTRHWHTSSSHSPWHTQRTGREMHQHSLLPGRQLNGLTTSVPVGKEVKINLLCTKMVHRSTRLRWKADINTLCSRPAVSVWEFSWHDSGQHQQHPHYVMTYAFSFNGLKGCRGGVCPTCLESNGLVNCLWRHSVLYRAVWA